MKIDCTEDNEGNEEIKVVLAFVPLFSPFPFVEIPQREGNKANEVV
jgi:hypothetical protein